MAAKGKIKVREFQLLMILAAVHPATVIAKNWRRLGPP
jgi:hypothetical protein